MSKENKLVTKPVPALLKSKNTLSKPTLIAKLLGFVVNEESTTQT